ncbi:hypothetical protein ABZ023_33540 [Streptomyces sp. NPDC006367]|uniref:hypothetical protein n=1 Tax=unclassified Streptomyces TaxID=2593676 RepID=UPI0033B6E6B8
MMGWRLGRRRGGGIRQAAHRAQWIIAVNAGYMAWMSAWSEQPRLFKTDPAEIPRTITGPLLARSQEIDEALGIFLACTPPAEVTELVDRARRLLKPLLDLQPAWITYLASCQEGRRLPTEDMDLDFGGFLLAEWPDEETAISAALTVAPILDQVQEALVPYSGVNLTARSAG